MTLTKKAYEKYLTKYPLDTNEEWSKNYSKHKDIVVIDLVVITAPAPAIQIDFRTIII